MFIFFTIWHNPNNNTYYYKKVHTFSARHPVGYINQYGHEVILTIELYKEYYRVPLKRRLIMKLISFLEKHK